MFDAVVASAGSLARIDGVRGVVHAVFPSSVYVETSDGSMLVVHDRSHGHTPTSLIVDADRPAGWGAAPGDAVAGRLGQLRCGGLRLDARQARIWRPRAAARRGAAVPAGPLATLVAKTAGDAFERLEPDCRRLADALATGDAEAVAAGARALVGKGPGLTPSGDDALVGLLAVQHRAHPGATTGLLGLLDAAIRPNLVRTTAISAHYLRLALDGHFGEHLSNLVDGLGVDGDIRPELVARVQSSGATSGADVLVGVIAGLRLLCELPSTHPVEEMT